MARLWRQWGIQYRPVEATRWDDPQWVRNEATARAAVDHSEVLRLVNRGQGVLRLVSRIVSDPEPVR